MGLEKKLVFTATYNELGNIEELCRLILDLPGDYDLLVVDDNSPDGSGEILARLAEGEPRLVVVRRPDKLGLGSAHKLAMLHAIRRDYDLLITMDADFSHDPRDIPRLTEQLENADFVIGSRYVEGSQCDYIGYRRFISVTANGLARRLLGLPLYEMTTSFRAFRVAMLKQLDFIGIGSEGYTFFMQMVYRIHQGGFKCREIPIHFRDRRKGVSKIPQLEAINGIFNLFRLFGSRLLNTPAVPCDSEQLGPCYACGHAHLVKRFRKSGSATEGAEAVQCTSMTHESRPMLATCLYCGLSFAPENLKNEKLGDLYADVVDEAYLNNSAAKRKTFQVAFDDISAYLPYTGRVLEIGAYIGLFGQIAREKGWEYVGIEPSRWASAHAREKLGLDVRTGSFQELLPTMKGERFDAIVMWDVIEHVHDPRALLEAARPLLRDSGAICLSTMDLDAWFPRLMGPRWPWIMDMHLFYFTQRSLGRLMEQAGLKPGPVHSYSHWIPLPYLFDKLAVLLPSVLRPLVRPFQWLAPAKVMLPVDLGDIKLFVAHRQDHDEPGSTGLHSKGDFGQNTVASKD